LDKCDTASVGPHRLDRADAERTADRLEVTQARLEAVNVDRNAQAARIGSQRILGQLEDALQRPLSGGPLPAFDTGSELTDKTRQATATR